MILLSIAEYICEAKFLLKQRKNWNGYLPQPVADNNDAQTWHVICHVICQHSISHNNFPTANHLHQRLCLIEWTSLLLCKLSASSIKILILNSISFVVNRATHLNVRAYEREKGTPLRFQGQTSTCQCTSMRPTQKEKGPNPCCKSDYRRRVR